MFAYRERKCADAIGTALVPCKNINIIFNKMCGSNFTKQHSGTVIV